MNQTDNRPQPRLFINYRSEDTGPTASRLYMELERELCSEQVFLDHERLEGGTEWPSRLQEEVERATVVFVLIGKRWLTAQDPETGDRRLNTPDDWVRQEIEIALKRQILVVPILVDGASPLTERAFETVPAIASLSKLQCINLRRKDWKADFNKLLQLLIELGFRPRTMTENIVQSNPSMQLVIDRVMPLRENRAGRSLVYGSIKLANGNIVYGEGLNIQLTLENTSNLDIIVRTIDVFIEDYDDHPIEVYNYSIFETSGTHLEIPGTTISRPIELTAVNSPGNLVPITNNRLFLRAAGKFDSQHTLNFSVVARAPGIWTLHICATYFDISQHSNSQQTKSGTLLIVKR